jgi:hypothetical protein
LYKNELEMLFLIMSLVEHGAAKWKMGLSCRSRTAIIGKQVNLGLEISMNDTNYLISSQHLVQN